MDNPKIESMGIGELKGYLCAKSGGKLTACKSCPGRDGCKAGKRAVELIAYSEEKAIGTVHEADLFRQACGSYNAWAWIEEHEKLSKAQAKERLIYYINKYPAISREFGGQKQIMKYRMTKEEKQEQPGKKQEESKTEKMSKKEVLESAHKALTEKAIAYWTECLNSPNPVEYHMRAKGVGIVTARTVVGKAKKKYASVIAIKGQKEGAETVEEVSIADFLKENEQAEKEPEKAEEKVSVKDELGGMFLKLDSEKKFLTEQIRKLEEKLGAVEEKFNALNIVLNMLRENK